MQKAQINTTLLVAAACLLYALSGGIRAIYGIIIGPLTQWTGIDYASASFAFGVAQLFYGLTQPVWGALALRRGNRLVLLTGALCMAVGLGAMPFVHSVAALTLVLGVLMASGTGALCFGLLMGTISPILGREKASAVSGVLNASSGIGGAVLGLVFQGITAAWNVQGSLLLLSGALVAMLPVIGWMTGARKEETAAPETVEENREGVGTLFRSAFRTWTFKALMIGFSTCGFHMIIIQTHLVTQMESYGISAATAALVYTGYGITSMVGSVLSGMLCLRFPLQRVLGGLYGARVVTVGLFMFLLPKTLLFLTVFALLLGLTGDATVTPTSEIVSRKFGPAAMGFLFGITFVCHQVGAFVSSWLGGIFYTQTGSYMSLWLADALLCALAAGVSWSIKKGM